MFISVSCSPWQRNYSKIRFIKNSPNKIEEVPRETKFFEHPKHDSTTILEVLNGNHYSESSEDVFDQDSIFAPEEREMQAHSPNQILADFPEDTIKQSKISLVNREVSVEKRLKQGRVSFYLAIGFLALGIFSIFAFFSIAQVFSGIAFLSFMVFLSLIVTSFLCLREVKKGNGKLTPWDKFMKGFGLFFTLTPLWIVLFIGYFLLTWT